MQDGVAVTVVVVVSVAWVHWLGRGVIALSTVLAVARAWMVVRLAQ